MPAIVGLAVQCGAPIAEEARRPGICAQTEVFEPRNAGPSDALRDIAREIEHRMARTLRWCKEGCIRPVGSQEALNKLWTNLIVLLADGRSECDANAVAAGAQSFHRRDRCFNHACQRAAPACMRGPDHPGGAVGEKQWPAVGS